jgi:transcriptional regulator with XRE-family HTH domain
MGDAMLVPETTEGARLRLGRELRRLRLRTGLTQISVAGILGCGQAKIQKIESTLVAISPTDLDLLLDAYHAEDVEVAALKKLAAEVDSWSRPRSEPRTLSFRKLSEREPEAREILCWHCEGIPGPLQSELYMLRQFGADTELRHQVTELIRLRTARTRIFTDDDPPHYQAILSESSLHRMPGGRSPELVLDQVEHLLEAMRTYENLTLRILTFEAQVAYVVTDFVVLRFADPADDIVYLEDPGEGRIVKKIAPFVKSWQRLHDAALSLDDSVKFLHRLAEETRGKWQRDDNN